MNAKATKSPVALAPALSPLERSNLAKIASAITSWAKADKAEQGALVNVFRTVAETGQEVAPSLLVRHAGMSEGSAAAMASVFNKACKVRKIIGAEATIDLIDKAAAMQGRKWERIRDALSTVQADAKATGTKLATTDQRGTMVTAAILAESVKDDQRAKAKAEKKAAGRAPQIPSAPAAPIPLATQAKELLAALQVLTGNVSRLPCAPEQTKRQARIVKLLQDAHEELAPLAK